ncbi:hypothetical protein TPHA_0F01380 [Tetrapisispora phaffii CBS 4417]|uniref:Zn(2)-C6 fungal-type domain-containing protein n=1 Tax=Tetrapisispora phaffii (strain ATCC 24235 / CBS 4417 / NBRC 1672 / NRRL Y-8282 / UCD 70-5) TaxID=1071381 RepID=G8BV40_TETPH|nr:hypothetical protein TPHA_0F01380 [Tetrapisispora phaffii CBS 4417]CCE63622.1 hypothetical protein TPHA_0F01380 [Tetrapisispora phaffii CBS 4417]
MNQKKVSPRRLQGTSDEVKGITLDDFSNQIQLKAIPSNDGSQKFELNYMNSNKLSNVASVTQKKRRRVTRACDECRKKKVKCDGQNPCIHCTVYSYKCSYDQPVKKNNTNHNTSGFSKKLNQTVTSSNNSSKKVNSREGLGKSTLTFAKTNLNSSTSSNKRKSNLLKNLDAKELKQAIDKYKFLLSDLFEQLPDPDSVDIETFAALYNKNKNDGLRLQFTSILNETLSQYGQLPEVNSSNKISSHVPPSITHYDVVENIDDSAHSQIGREIKIILPPKNVVLHFISYTWENCCVLFRFYHRPSFLKKLDALYETDPDDYTEEQIKFLPLCYATIAVGILFYEDKKDRNSTSKFSKDLNVGATYLDESLKSKFNEYKLIDGMGSVDVQMRSSLIQDEGYKFFIASRKLIDMTNVRGRHSIQTIIILLFFCQCSARLTTCYSYIGAALRAALKEGYHRRVDPNNTTLNPIEIEMRKRIFYTIYKLDVYVNSMMGLPRSLSEDDFDQELPIEISDECITENGYLSEQEGQQLSSISIANYHTKLYLILADIVQRLYSIKKKNRSITENTVISLENKLRKWADSLPHELKPGAVDVPQKYERANKLLHLSYLQVQLILYRPFIHYLSRNLRVPSNIGPYEIARKSIAVSRNVMQLVQLLMSNNLLPDAYWYGVYTVFFSIAGLLYYVQQVHPTSKEEAQEYYAIVNEIEIGRSVLLELKDSSAAANRTYCLLNRLFEKLNLKTLSLAKDHSDDHNLDTNMKEKDEVSGRFGANPDINITYSNKLPSSHRIFDSDSAKKSTKQESLENLNINEFSLPTDMESKPDNRMHGNVFNSEEMNNYHRKTDVNFDNFLQNILTQMPFSNNSNDISTDFNDPINECNPIELDSFIKDMFQI